MARSEAPSLPRVGFLLALGAAVAPGAQTPEAVRETVVVVELSVVADVPARRGTLGWDPVGVDDVELYEDGIQREVTQIDDESTAGWRILVWIDGERCVAEQLQRQLRALGAAGEELVDLGEVEIVVADSLPRRLPAPRGETGWADLLRDPASALGCRDAAREATARLRRESRSAEALELAVSSEIARNDLLLRAVGSAAGERPAMLILLARGYDHRPHLRWAEPERPAGAAVFAERAAAATEELGEGLAEGGWTVLVPALPAVRSGGSRGVPGGLAGPPSAPAGPWPMLRVWPRRSRGQLRQPDDYEIFLDFTLEPWRRVAALTAGAIASSDADLGAALAEARGKRRVWYRSSRPQPGESRAIHLRLRRSDGRPIRAPARLPARWASAALASARLRSAEAGEGRLPWDVERSAGGWRLASRDDFAGSRRVRWALVPRGARQPEFHYGDFGREATLPAPGATSLAAALYLEDLESGAWIAVR